MKNRTSKRLTNSAGSLYGVMIGDIAGRVRTHYSRDMRKRVTTWVACLSLLASLCSGIMVTDSASASPKKERRAWAS